MSTPHRPLGRWGPSPAAGAGLGPHTRPRDELVTYLPGRLAERLSTLADRSLATVVVAGTRHEPIPFDTQLDGFNVGIDMDQVLTRCVYCGVAVANTAWQRAHGWQVVGWQTFASRTSPLSGEVADLQWDHRVPKSTGGSNHPSNLSPSCPRCNARKGTKTVEEFEACRASGR